MFSLRSLPLRPGTPDGGAALVAGASCHRSRGRKRASIFHQNFAGATATRAAEAALRLVACRRDGGRHSPAGASEFAHPRGAALKLVSEVADMLDLGSQLLCGFLNRQMLLSL